MSDAVLMIEAGDKSGSLISARLAGEYGRELLCIPHRIGDANGYGSHLFMRLGATLPKGAFVFTVPDGVRIIDQAALMGGGVRKP